ncbi:hypothetical protein SIID45300_01886 [Candidatus Magnetaquicoccaceae bacterium FCR-1]|uniref:DUF1640 domain-containing protein n=1 Tax=Candidatus Magnetaquiglobus chichijimensis TaxID=3141448 RepID=A0ABQ0C9J0_9PROT
MSTAIAFDTYAYVRKLRDAGVDEAQAAIQAEALVALVEDRLATKQDVAMLQRDLAEDDNALRRELAMVKADLQRDIETSKVDLKRDLKELELRMVIKTGAMIIGGIGVLFGLMRVWPLPVQYVAPPGQEIRLPAPLPAR